MNHHIQAAWQRTLNQGIAGALTRERVEKAATSHWYLASNAWPNDINLMSSPAHRGFSMPGWGRAYGADLPLMVWSTLMSL